LGRLILQYKGNAVKYLRFGILGGFAIFIIALAVGLISSMIYPPLLVSLEFKQDIYLYALVTSLYVAFSLSLPHIIEMPDRSSDSQQKLNVKRKRFSTITVVGILSALLFAWLTYIEIVSSSASFFHQSALKENVKIEATANSAWPARRDLRKDCQHHLLFDTPAISSSVQFVCINWNQWTFFRSAEMPIKVILYGKKSYFGYELKCCQ
jgi:hypothetical protein